MKNYSENDPLERSSSLPRTNNTERALALCGGVFQRDVVLGRQTLGGSTLKGKAKRYSIIFRQSVQSLLSRLREHGIPYEIDLDEQGGYDSSRLIILNR